MKIELNIMYFALFFFFFKKEKKKGKKKAVILWINSIFNYKSRIV